MSDNDANVTEETTQVAVELLDELLAKMGVEATLEPRSAETVMPSEEAKDAVVFDIQGEDLGALIGRRGQTLSCLQYLLRLMVASRVSSFAPIILDVNGYRQRRYRALQTLASRIAEDVVVNRMPSALEPMPAFERRIIHITLAEHPLVTTQSIGFGDNRKVVVVLKEE
jgi:spoIIIJ-associated protein